MFVFNHQTVSPEARGVDESVGREGGWGRKSLVLFVSESVFVLHSLPSTQTTRWPQQRRPATPWQCRLHELRNKRGRGPNHDRNKQGGAAAEEKVGGGAWCGARAASVESLVPACATRRRPPKRLSTRRATVCVDRKKKGKSDEKTCHCKVVERRLLTARASVFFCPWGQPQ